MTLRPAVFLDRDGVLNVPDIRHGKSYAPVHAKDFVIYPEAPEALERLKALGFVLVVITNQPDVGNRLTDRAEVQAMHLKLQKNLPLDDIKICYHAQNAGCSCRKPAPGMILSAAEELSINLSQSYVIGDRWSDVEAAHAAGCFSIFIDRHYAEPISTKPDLVARSLNHAVDMIVARVGHPESNPLENQVQKC